MTATPRPDRQCREHAEEIAALRRAVADHDRALADLRGQVGQLTDQLADLASGERTDRAHRGRPSASVSPAARPAEPRVARSGLPYADHGSPKQAKIALYRALFTGRGDVYARRWENRSKGTHGWTPVHTGNWRTPRDQREYLPLTDNVIEAHLEGSDTVGVYPLLADDSCRLLACDFDKTSWRLDVLAYLDAAHAAGVPTAVEISRSGDGAHVWTFLTGPVPAADARAVGAALLREAIALRGELDLDSYDRLFPSQDYLPERGFGNLIALPLQGRCRREANTTVFVDPRTFEPHPDQFAFLAALPRMTPAQVRRVADQLPPVAVGPDTHLYHPSVRPDPAPPPVIHARLGGMLAIRRAGLPPGLYASLKHLAMLHNPQFHKNENLRLSNHATPRFIRCYAEDLEHLYLPRGLTDRATQIIAEAGSRLTVADVRTEPDPIEVAFTGELRDAQAQAVQTMAGHDLGVLEAPPGAGKTVMACALIARHHTPTLVLVDRKPLLQQWRDQLRAHLGIEAGQIGAGKHRPTKTLDIAMLQTVTRSDRPAELLAGYGLVVVDECHHVPAPTVERAVRDLPAHRWLGLTATPTRPDGLKEIMIMQCGPIRHRVQQTRDDRSRTLHVHPTDLRVTTPTDGLTRGEVLALVHAALVDDAARTSQICADVARSMREGRHCLVLSGRTEHVETLAHQLRRHGLDPLILHGALKPKQRQAVHHRLGDAGQLLLVATDRYIGEGFDCPRLDTLFLTFPVSATTRITQYVGRILRDHPGKHDVEVHDYLDVDAPMLAAMYRRRRAAYKHLGFAAGASADTPDRHTQSTATRNDGPAPPQPRRAVDPETTGPAAARVRAWARQAGLTVRGRGRLSADIWQAYRAAHP